MDLLKSYKNGNYNVRLYKDGTKERISKDGTFIPVFPENIDLKITDCCDRGCEFCYEGSSPEGKHGDFNHEFFHSLKTGTELAIGGGNVLEHPKLEMLLDWCKSRGIVANMTLNQNHFVSETSYSYYLDGRVLDFIERGKVNGIGISFNGNLQELEEIKRSAEKGYYGQYFDRLVIHVINGVHSHENIVKIAKMGFKILILGYKQRGRGINFQMKNQESIDNNMTDLYENIHKLVKESRLISFDNLAIEQLDIKRLFTQDEWSKFYMGDDGDFTMYIDLVNGRFARNSVSEKTYEITGSIEEMFGVVRKEKMLL